ncbi:uncharacterized protein LOC128928132 [Callithrix jacchus]
MQSPRIAPPSRVARAAAETGSDARPRSPAKRNQSRRAKPSGELPGGWWRWGEPPGQHHQQLGTLLAREGWRETRGFPGNPGRGPAVPWVPEPSRGKTGRRDGSVEGSHRLFCGARLPHLPEEPVWREAPQPTAARSRAGFPPRRPRLSRDGEDFVTPPRATREMVHRHLQTPPPPGRLTGAALPTSPWTLRGGRVGSALLPQDPTDAPRGAFRAQWSGKGGAAPLRRPGPDLRGRLSAKSPGEDSDNPPTPERDFPPAPEGRPEDPQVRKAGPRGSGVGRGRPRLRPPEPTAASLPASGSIAPLSLQAPTGSSSPPRLSSLLFACRRQ